MSHARLRNFSHIIFLEAFQESFGRFARKVRVQEWESKSERGTSEPRDRERSMEVAR